MCKKVINAETQFEKAEIQEIVKNLTLFDDDLMSRVFDNNFEATELFLSIVIGEKIKVESVVGQDELKNPVVGGRSITLDVHAIDERGRHIDIEVQSNSKGSNVKRARFHSSMVDSRILNECQEFNEFQDSYVIFMYKHDKFGKGLPVYHAERYVSETMELFNDGSHIIYVNGRYKGDDPIGWLVADFYQTDAEKMHYKELADGVKYFKEYEKGCGDMCDAVEKYGDKRAEKAAAKAKTEEKINSVNKLIKNMNLTLEQALNMLEIQGDERILITEQFQK